MSMQRPVAAVLFVLLVLCFASMLSEAGRERAYSLHESVLRSLPLALRNSTSTAGVEPPGHVKALVDARVEAFLRVVAPLSGIWLWLAPLPTLQRARRAGTTAGLTPLPCQLPTRTQPNATQPNPTLLRRIPLTVLDMPFLSSSSCFAPLDFAMLANGWLWTCYGTTVGWDKTILVPNFACCVSGLYYCRAFACCDSGRFSF